MKRCRACQTVLLSSQGNETAYISCRLCGGADFTDIKEEELQQTLRQLVRRELCCPNPKCEPRLFTNEDNFCSKCASSLERSTLDLWIQKCVEPCLEKNPEQLFFDRSLIIETARIMGFSSERAIGRLETKIQEWSGQSGEIVAQWISQSKKVLNFISRDDHVGINFSQNLYQNFRTGRTVVGFIMRFLETSGSIKTSGKSEADFIDYDQWKYIGFHNGTNRTEVWLYPIPNRSFFETTFNEVFPDLSPDNYATGNIEPRKAFLVSADSPGIWSLAPPIESWDYLSAGFAASARKADINEGFIQRILKYLFLIYTNGDFHPHESRIPLSQVKFIEVNYSGGEFFGYR